MFGSPQSKRRRKGVTTALVLLGSTVILGASGLTIDAGRLYMEKQIAQAAADAAVFAGTLDLPRASQAIASGRLAAAQNGFPDAAVTTKINNAGIANRVEAVTQRTVPLVFSAFVGTPQATVRGQARASKFPPPNRLRGVVPWGIEPQDMSYGDQRTLKLGSSDQDREFPSGNFHCLTFGDTGASTYEHWLKWGYSSKMTVGQYLLTEPGNVTGPTNHALASDEDSRFERAEEVPWSNDSWSAFDRGNPLVVTLPIVDWRGTDKNGRTIVQVLGFAAFYIENYQNGGNGSVTGRFIRYVDTENAESDPNYLTGVEGGVWIVRLDL